MSQWPAETKLKPEVLTIPFFDGEIQLNQIGLGGAVELPGGHQLRHGFSVNLTASEAQDLLAVLTRVLETVRKEEGLK
jgi:hypothetical protein